MTREETIKRLAMVMSIPPGPLSPAAIYDQFIAPLEAKVEKLENPTYDWVGALNEWKRSAGAYEARALAAEAARDEALALLWASRGHVAYWQHESSGAAAALLKRIDAALAPAMEKEEG